MPSYSQVIRVNVSNVASKGTLRQTDGVWGLLLIQATDRQTDNSVVGALKRGNEGPEALSPRLF